MKTKIQMKTSCGENEMILMLRNGMNQPKVQNTWWVVWVAQLVSQQHRRRITDTKKWLLRWVTDE